jgi:predicted nuclease with TOPRIM domain
MQYQNLQLKEQNNTTIIIRIDGKEFYCNIENPKVIDILQKIPENKIRDYIEMYILIGDTVLSYATIQTSEETLQKYFGDIVEKLSKNVADIDKLREKVERGISESLPEMLKKEINSGLKEKLDELKSTTTTLNKIKDQMPETLKPYLGNLEKITNNLSDFSYRFKGTKEKGIIGEELVYQILVEYFKEDNFEKVSTQKNHSDIKASSNDMVDILIEVKNYETPVPSNQIQKFWSDLESQGINIGCFVSLNSSIQGDIGNYKIISNGNKLGIFINASQFMGQNGIEDSIRLIYFIAKKFAQYFKQIEKAKIEDGTISSKLDKILSEINHFKSQLERLKKIRADLKQIEKITQENIYEIENLYRELDNRIEKIINNEP